MPPPRSDFPAYRHHRPSGQAVVTIAGDDHYLGKFGSPASRKEYDRLIMEWTAAGRPQRGHTVNDLTVVELCLTYLKFAKGYYTSSGRTTGEIHPLKAIIKTLREHYGERVKVPLVLLKHKHWSSSGQDSAPVMRGRRFESGPVLSISDNLVVTEKRP